MPHTKKLTVYIGIGSNLDNPKQHVTSAVEEFTQIKGISDVKLSSLYSNAAIGPKGQPDFVNGVIQAATTLEPESLLDALQNIENNHSRVRSIRWGARTLDLDILLYGDHIIQTPRLTVPHKEMCNRNFVITPLWELAPALTLPTGERVDELLPKLADHDLIPL